MRVRAADGLRVPMEHAPRDYIEAKSREVKDTLYYRRRVATGELIRLDQTKPEPPPAATPETKDQATTETKVDAKPAPKKRTKA